MPSPSHVGPSKPVYAGKVTKGRIKALTRGQGSGIISAPRGDPWTDVQVKWALERAASAAAGPLSALPA